MANSEFFLSFSNISARSFRDTKGVVSSAKLQTCTLFKNRNKSFILKGIGQNNWDLWYSA